MINKLGWASCNFKHSEATKSTNSVPYYLKEFYFKADFPDFSYASVNISLFS